MEPTEQEKKAAEEKARKEAEEAAKLKALVDAAIEKERATLTAQIKAELEAKVKATDNAGGLANVGSVDTRGAKDLGAEGLPKGVGFARHAKAAAVARMSGQNVVVVAKSMYGDGFARALQQSVSGNGGSTVFPQYVSEMIELLREAAIMRSLPGIRIIQMDSSALTMNRQTGAGTAYYSTAEGNPITPSQQTTDVFTLSEKKLTALTPVSNDLIRNSSISADAFVRDDLVRVMALREDLAFLRGNGSSGTPTGLNSLIAAGHKYNAAYATGVAPTLANVEKELNFTLYKLRQAKIPLVNLFWIMSPRTELYLKTLLDGNGNRVYATEMNTSGTLMGKPYFVTTQEPDNLSDGTNSDASGLYMGSAVHLVIGDRMNLEIAVAENGTYEEGGNVKSGFSRDETVIRTISKHDFNVRHEECAVRVLVRWGA